MTNESRNINEIFEHKSRYFALNGQSSLSLTLLRNFRDRLLEPSRISARWAKCDYLSMRKSGITKHGKKNYEILIRSRKCLGIKIETRPSQLLLKNSKYQVVKLAVDETNANSNQKEKQFSLTQGETSLIIR